MPFAGAAYTNPSRFGAVYYHSNDRATIWADGAASHEAGRKRADGKRHAQSGRTSIRCSEERQQPDEQTVLQTTIRQIAFVFCPRWVL